MANLYSPTTSGLLNLQNTPYTGVSEEQTQPQYQQQPQQGGGSSYSVPKLKNLTNSIDKFGENLGFGSGVEALSTSLTPEFATGLLQTGGSGAAGYGLNLTNQFGSGLLQTGGSGAFGTGTGVTSQISSGLSGSAGNAGALTQTPLSNVLGAAGIGWIGGGLIGGKKGSILGAVGGAAGSALAGSSTGAAIGAALGIGSQALNFALPGAGILIGGIAGKLFTKKPSDKTMAGGVNLWDSSVDPRFAKEESSTGKKFDQNNANVRDELQTGVSQYTKFLLDNGATPKGNKQIALVNGSRDGFKYWFQNPDLTERTPIINIKDAKEFQKRLIPDINAQYNIPPELAQKLKTLNATDLKSMQNTGSLTYRPPSVGGYSQAQAQTQAPTGPTPFQQFVQKYKANQNANAA